MEWTAEAGAKRTPQPLTRQRSHIEPGSCPPATHTQAKTQPTIQRQNLNITVDVQGTTYELPNATDNQIREYAQTLEKFAMTYAPSNIDSATAQGLSAKLADLRLQLSRSEAETRALLHAANATLDAERMDRDIKKLRQVGSMSKLIEWHASQHQTAGMNAERITQWLPHDPALPKILDICNNGVTADVDPKFIRTDRTAPLRELQRRLTPVYYKAAAEMHDTHKVLLFRKSDLTQSEIAELHLANEYHWRPEPGKIAGRPLMDCSNAPPGVIPLNTETTKTAGIARYQQVKLPTFRDVLTEWDRRRAERQLTWQDIWMFKADITGCFNQIRWSPETAKLMGFMLDDENIMIMITCGFGVTVTPMAWSIIGDAMNRTVNARAPSTVSTFVDDFFGSGTRDEALECQQIVHDTIRGVLGNEGLSVKKNVFAQKAEILGFLVDCTAGTVRPKDHAIDKLFYVLFSADMTRPQPLKYWECLSSLTTLYAPVMWGMTPFVAAITRMVKRGHRSRRTTATPVTAFAVHVWRVTIVNAVQDPASCAMPISMYIHYIPGLPPFVIISDASPWRLCAAIYSPHDGRLLMWSTYRLPYARDVHAQYQGQREYMGHLFSTILFEAYCRLRLPPQTPKQYQWVNDNKGALAWARKHKCSSLAGQYTCFAVTQIHMATKILPVDPQYKPGAEMGEVDLMSRIPDGQHPTAPASRAECPSLYPHLWWEAERIPTLNRLFQLIDPTIVRSSTTDHYVAYNTVHSVIHDLLTEL
jgi:hypothetical protein